MIDGHAFAAIASSVGGLYGGALYVRAVLAGHTKPHIFTWIIWATLAGIACAVAFYEGAYWSAVVLSSTVLLCGATAVAGCFNGDKYITRSDIASFLSALAAIPLWLVTEEPGLAVILICVINFLGFIPTLRKAWVKPFEENKEIFMFYTVTALLGVLSITPFTWITAPYMTQIFVCNVLLVALIVLRRRATMVS